VATFGDERLKPCVRFGDGIRLRDADRVESVCLRLLGDIALYFGGISQKSRSP
jgi:hypothetical protein